jgi:hypothetical protein
MTVAAVAITPAAVAVTILGLWKKSVTAFIRLSRTDPILMDTTPVASATLLGDSVTKPRFVTLGKPQQ